MRGGPGRDSRTVQTGRLPELQKVLKTCAEPVPEGPAPLVEKRGGPIQREGRVCAGDPGRVSCTVQIISFQNFFERCENWPRLSKKSFLTAWAGPSGAGFFLRDLAVRRL